MKKPAKTPPKAKAQDPKQPETRGRKGSITIEKTAKFLVALENGLTAKEAQLQAEISQDAYDRLMKKSATFRGQVAAAKMKLTMKARSNVAADIANGNVKTSQWWLERKEPEEFRPKTGDDGAPFGLPPGSVVILPGDYPHPRIVPPPKKDAKDS